MLDLEHGLDTELGTLLDREGLVLQRVEGTGSRKVDNNIRASFSLEGQGFDDAFSGIVRVCNCVAGVQTQRRLPSVERFVIRI